MGREERCEPMRRSRQAKRGFSLVELSIVIGTISILATLSMSYFQNALAQSRDSESSLMLSSIERTMIDYYNNNGQYPPVAAPQNPSADLTAGKQQWVDGQAGWTDLQFTGNPGSYRFRYSFVPGFDSSNKATSVTLTAIGIVDNSGVPVTHTVVLQEGDEIASQ